MPINTNDITEPEASQGGKNMLGVTLKAKYLREAARAARNFDPPVLRVGGVHVDPQKLLMDVLGVTNENDEVRVNFHWFVDRAGVFVRFDVGGKEHILKAAGCKHVAVRCEDPWVCDCGCQRCEDAWENQKPY